ncbi:hypothetical protein [Paenibacillus sp. YPG26]|nr:hypothetical protein [Paenibacillus sp. YPG26]
MYGLQAALGDHAGRGMALVSKSACNKNAGVKEDKADKAVRRQGE